MSRKAYIAAFVLLFSLLSAGCGSESKIANGAAVKYPVKPITVIVPFSAGGMTDILTRAMEKSAGKNLGQPFIIVNKPGGAGTIAWNELVKTKPDGYTLGVVTIGTILQPIYGQCKYNYPTALEPIAQFANPPFAMSIVPNSKFKTLDELIQYAKEHPGEVKFGHSGLGAGTHVLAEMFARAAGIKMEQVPFQGSAEELAALLGGHIDVIISGTPELREYVRSNKIKVLAITGSHKLDNEDFSEVPTFKELGYDVKVNNIHCLAVSKEMPEDIKRILVQGIKNIINDQEYQETMRQLGLEAEYMGPQECINEWVTDSEILTKAVHDTGVFERISAQKN